MDTNPDYPVPDVRLQTDTLTCTACGSRLVLEHHGREQACFDIAPIIDGKPTAIDAWRSDRDDHHVADVEDSTSVHLAIVHGRVCLWLETNRSFIHTLTLLHGGWFAGGAWHSFVPDEWDRTWPCELDAAVAASSNYVGMNVDDGGMESEPDGAGMTDPGDLVPTWIFNIPAHLFAFKGTHDQWSGVCLPHPHAMGAVRYRMDRGVFSLSVDTVQAACPESGCPRLYFETAMREPYELCDRHYALSEQLGLTHKNAKAHHPDWWAHPYYKSYDDMRRVEQEEGGYVGHFKEVNGKKVCAVNREHMIRWHGLVEEKTDLPGKVNVLFDQVYFARYGDYRQVNADLGGVEGFRALIDEWKARGVRTALYFHPFTISLESEVYLSHPEICVEHLNPHIKYTHGVTVGSQGATFADWTHPAARQHMLDMVEFLLSDKPGCLNADWLAINNTIGPDPRWYGFHDPDWGIGDLMQLKVQKLIYEHAKALKPDCMVRRQSALAPYMEPYYDEAQLCEEWNGSTQAWWRRGRIATRLIKHNIAGFDPWFITLTKAYEYYQGLAAVFVPATEASTDAIHPYTYYRPLKEKDYHRRKAGMQAYLNAPQWTSDEKRVELTDAGQFIAAWRKRTEGPLAGFYAAIAISPRALITYSDTQALISASESRTVDVLLPPQASLISVDRIGHDSKVSPHEYTIQDDGSVRLHIEDAAGPSLLVRLRYQL